LIEDDRASDSSKDLFTIILKETDMDPYNHGASMNIEDLTIYHKNSCDSYLNGLPNYILDKVADINVLGLNRATKEVIDFITAYSESNQQIVDDAFKEYFKYQKETKVYLNESLIELYNLHDCTINNVDITDNLIVFELDNRGGFTNYSKISFLNVTGFNFEDNINSSWCLYSELHLLDKSIEFQMLIQNQGNLEEISIVFDELELE
ncbi:DUF4085 domain-containing protein, partial [Candidatus Izimaplasma bacterium]|nr:DUF4085 domain-containing protein [Candidatus Izimaplasma bacterium]